MDATKIRRFREQIKRFRARFAQGCAGALGSLLGQGELEEWFARHSARCNTLAGIRLKALPCVLDSHAHLLQRELIPRSAGSIEIAKSLYDAPIAVLAHDTSPDPIFFYANRLAQRLFEMTWKEMVAMPSSHSAEPLAREERQRLLDRVSFHGYIDDYTGVRISRSGNRFLIENATVWNLIDSVGNVIGQAAAFDHWTPIA